MQIFLRFTAIYFLFGLAFVGMFREMPVTVIGDMAASLPWAMTLFLTKGWWVMIGFAALFFLFPPAVLVTRIPRAVAMLGGCSFFFLTFTMLKTTLPFVVPFWADPVLATIDRALHFGTDPWKLTHALLPVLPGEWWQTWYMGLWMIPSMYFPVLLVLFDGDDGRVRRYLILYVWAWAGIGTLCAMMFMSGGPIYFERLTGGDNFTPMMDALKAHGITDSSIGATQAHLWKLFQTGSRSLGSGISAFPSVHVAVASVIALYLAERVRFALIPMIGVIAAYQVLSVHLGWHYAIDGYFSILTVVALRHWLARPLMAQTSAVPASS